MSTENIFLVWKLNNVADWFIFLPVSHRSERGGRRALSIGELRSGGRPHRGLQTQAGSACAGGQRNQNAVNLFDWMFLSLTCPFARQEEEQRLSELSQQKKQGLSLGSIASRFWRSKQQ